MRTENLELKIRPAYSIWITKNAVTFIWSSTPQAPLSSSVDLNARVNPDEILKLAKDFECPIKDNVILVQNLEVYNRLLIYACVRPSLRKNLEGVRSLSESICDMTSWDAHYWASAFRELWWKHKRRRSLIKTVKAFKLFFGIE